MLHAGVVWPDSVGPRFQRETDVCSCRLPPSLVENSSGLPVAVASRSNMKQLHDGKWCGHICSLRQAEGYLLFAWLCHGWSVRPWHRQRKDNPNQFITWLGSAPIIASASLAAPCSKTITCSEGENGSMSIEYDGYDLVQECLEYYVDKSG